MFGCDLLQVLTGQEHFLRGQLQGRDGNLETGTWIWSAHGHAAAGTQACARTHARQRLLVGVEIEARARVQAVAERATQVAQLREQESALSSQLQEVWGEVEAARGCYSL